MILQSVVHPCDVCRCTELFYRCDSAIVKDEKTLMITNAKSISFFSYMNCFDIDFWKEYTSVLNVHLVLEVSGKGAVLLKCRDGQEDICISKYAFKTCSIEEFQQIRFDINLCEHKGMCYFEVESDSGVVIRDIRYETIDDFQTCQKVYIALNICTYHRNDAILKNLIQLKQSRFFDEQDYLHNKLSIVVVDNGSELKTVNEHNIKLIHNRNTGGAGGFKRGLDEIRNCNGEVTHVIFMDDDVDFINESLYRLHALYSYVRPEYAHEVVAGRMFRMDKREIQYSAAEIWNKSNIKHIGLNKDMTIDSNIQGVNNNSGAEYGGWWFCSYPISFVKNNDPIPFFIHCDDVEYGLRHGGTPIIMNGIQVWHETYEYRQTPVLAYYDTRNSFFVNQVRGYEMDYNEIMCRWFELISNAHIEKKYLHEYMHIRALRDFLRGMRWLEKIDSEKYHRKLLRKRARKVYNKIYWRYTKYLLERRIKRTGAKL